ncbi:unnamed protein product, partial [Heterosigma akashiwo]
PGGSGHDAAAAGRGHARHPAGGRRVPRPGARGGQHEDRLRHARAGEDRRADLQRARPPGPGADAAG